MGSSESKTATPHQPAAQAAITITSFSRTVKTRKNITRYFSEVLLSIITVIKILELIYLLYTGYVRKMKKKYFGPSNTA